MPSVVKDFKGNKDAVVSTVARIKSLNLMKILPQWSFYSSLVDTCLFLVHALELRWLTFKEYGTKDLDPACEYILHSPIFFIFHLPLLLLLFFHLYKRRKLVFEGKIWGIEIKYQE